MVQGYQIFTFSRNISVFGRNCKFSFDFGHLVEHAGTPSRGGGCLDF